MRRALQLVAEGEVSVDEKGYAHDDEGNSWYVGMAQGVYKASQVPLPSAKGGARRGTARRGWGSVTRELKGDEKKRAEALSKALEKKTSDGDRKFLWSVHFQATRGKPLSAKQSKVVAKILRRLGLKDEAALFEQTTTTAGIQARDTSPIHYPHPFAFPIVPKVPTVPPGEAKARSACMKAMEAYVSGKKAKAEVDRICGGLGK